MNKFEDKVTKFLESPWSDVLMIFFVGSTIVMNMASVVSSDDVHELRRLALSADVVSALWFGLYLTMSHLATRSRKMSKEILDDWQKWINEIKAAAEKAKAEAEAEEKAESDAKTKKRAEMSSPTPTKSIVPGQPKRGRGRPRKHPIA